MISAIFSAISMVLGLLLDIVTLPFRLVFALLGGAEFEFSRFSRGGGGGGRRGGGKRRRR